MVKRWFAKKAKALGGAWTTRQMAEEMKRAWNCDSVGTVHRIAMELGYRRMRMTTVPMLTDSHKAQREKWVSDLLQREDGPFGDGDTVYIHVDEKWFYGLRPSKWFWVAKDEDRPVTAILSRSHLNKVMFLGAVARPLPQHNFDGMIGLYPVGDLVPAQRSSRNRPAGSLVFRGANMDADMFCKMLKESVIPDAIRKAPWAHRIVIQMDNAGGHGGGRGDVNATTCARLNEWARDLPRDILEQCDDPDNPPQVEFVAQPPRSPDLNVLDLGAWNSMNVAVDAQKNGHHLRQLSQEEIYHIVQSAWNSWAAADKLASLFATLTPILPLVVHCNGGNNYTIPH